MANDGVKIITADIRNGRSVHQSGFKYAYSLLRFVANTLLYTCETICCTGSISLAVTGRFPVYWRERSCLFCLSRLVNTKQIMWLLAKPVIKQRRKRNNENNCQDNNE
jgi:hypothetical protein